MEEDLGDWNDMKYEEITSKIIGCAYSVWNEMGSGFLESVYEECMVIALRDDGLDVVSQYPIEVNFREKVVGRYFADLFVANKVIVELKAVSSLANEHFAQTRNYLSATKLDVALLINFSPSKLEHKRIEKKTISSKS